MAKKTEKLLFISSRSLMQYVLRVTGLGGLPGLPGRVTLSAGVTIRHVKVSRWGNPPNRGRFRGKKLKAKHVCYKTFYISEPSHGRNH